jgi:hypothetical protein
MTVTHSVFARTPPDARYSSLKLQLARNELLDVLDQTSFKLQCRNLCQRSDEENGT